MHHLTRLQPTLCRPPCPLPLPPPSDPTSSPPPSPHPALQLLLVLGLVLFLFGRTLYAELDVDAEMARGSLPGGRVAVGGVGVEGGGPGGVPVQDPL